MIPADGWLAGGYAVVDERLVRGLAGPVAEGGGRPGLRRLVRRRGAAVYRGLGAGRGDPGRSPRIARWPAPSRTPPAEFALTAQGEAFARRTVGPTLAVAGLGLAVGDLTTAAAILRPDYATGPGLGVSMESVRDVAACAGEGVMIRDASAFQRIASADVFIFDHHPTLERTGLEVRAVQAIDGAGEDEVLRLAASALGDLADERFGGPERGVRRAASDRPPRSRGPATGAPRSPSATGRVRSPSATCVIRMPPGTSRPAWRSRPTVGPSAGSRSGGRRSPWLPSPFASSGGTGRS